MNEKFLLQIHSVEKINYNDLTDVIISINWTYYYIINSVDRQALRSMKGTYHLDLPNSENFIAITEIDGDTLIDWMKSGISSFSKQVDFDAMDERLRFMMDIEIKPSVSAMIDGLNKLNQEGL